MPGIFHIPNLGCKSWKGLEEILTEHGKLSHEVEILFYFLYFGQWQFSYQSDLIVCLGS